MMPTSVSLYEYVDVGLWESAFFTLRMPEGTRIVGDVSLSGGIVLLPDKTWMSTDDLDDMCELAWKKNFRPLSFEELRGHCDG